jgi:hypothetical protein
MTTVGICAAMALVGLLGAPWFEVAIDLPGSATTPVGDWGLWQLTDWADVTLLGIALVYAAALLGGSVRLAQGMAAGAVAVIGFFADRPADRGVRPAAVHGRRGIARRRPAVGRLALARRRCCDAHRFAHGRELDPVRAPGEEDDMRRITTALAVFGITTFMN